MRPDRGRLSPEALTGRRGPGAFFFFFCLKYGSVSLYLDGIRCSREWVCFHSFIHSFIHSRALIVVQDC